MQQRGAPCKRLSLLRHKFMQAENKVERSGLQKQKKQHVKAFNMNMLTHAIGICRRIKDTSRNVMTTADNVAENIRYAAVDTSGKLKEHDENV
jgi:hypothetical protein